MPRPSKILSLLKPGEVAAYEEFLRVGQPSIDDGVTWLAEHFGIDVSRKAVWTHKRDFEEMLKGVKAAAEMSRAYAAVAKEAGVTGGNDTLIHRVQQLQMEWAFA